MLQTTRYQTYLYRYTARTHARTHARMHIQILNVDENVETMLIYDVIYIFKSNLNPTFFQLLDVETPLQNVVYLLVKKAS